MITIKSLSIICIYSVIIVGNNLAIFKSTSEDCQEFYTIITKQQIHLDPEDDDDGTWYGFPFLTSGLYQDSAFTQIYNQPESFFDCYVRILNDQNLDSRYKHIALLAMQGGDIEIYLKVLRETFYAFQTGRINSESIVYAVMIDSPNGNVLKENQNHPQVRFLLNEISTDSRSPIRLKKYIEKFMYKNSKNN